MPNLTPNEIEDVLDALENMIAWTANAPHATEESFRAAREAAHLVWQNAVTKIDSNKE